MTISSFAKKEDWITTSVELIADILKKSPGEKHIALSGGSTPEPVYESLSLFPIDYSMITFYLVDERYIPSEDKNSNAFLLNKTLVNKNKSKHAKFEFYDTELPIESCLDDYDLKLRLIPNKKLNLSILGIGPDGHFGSVFPNTNFEENDLVAHTTTENFQIFDRLTMTPKMILNSENIIVLLKGKNKKDILDELILQHSSINDLSFPAGMLKKHDKLNILYCSEN